MTPLTKAEWKKELERVLAELYGSYPYSNPKWRFETAHKHMRRRHGPEPPGTAGLALKTIRRLLTSGGDMKFDWLKNIWKGVRGALLTAIIMVALTFLGMIDTEQEILALGIPAWLAPILILVVGAAIPMLRNWLKIVKGWKV